MVLHKPFWSRRWPFGHFTSFAVMIWKISSFGFIVVVVDCPSRGSSVWDSTGSTRFVKKMRVIMVVAISVTGRYFMFVMGIGMRAEIKLWSEALVWKNGFWSKEWKEKEEARGKGKERKGRKFNPSRRV